MGKKKLFISIPMRDRTEEQIKNSMQKMHKMAELVLEEDLEPIESLIKGEPPKGANEPVWCLGKSIEMLSEADYMIGLAEIDSYSGCLIEREIALRYGIPYIRAFAEQVAPDIIMQLQEQQNQNNVEYEDFTNRE